MSETVCVCVGGGRGGGVIWDCTATLLKPEPNVGPINTRNYICLYTFQFKDRGIHLVI